MKEGEDGFHPPVRSAEEISNEKDSRCALVFGLFFIFGVLQFRRSSRTPPRRATASSLPPIPPRADTSSTPGSTPPRESVEGRETITLKNLGPRSDRRDRLRLERRRSVFARGRGRGPQDLPAGRPPPPPAAEADPDPPPEPLAPGAAIDLDITFGQMTGAPRGASGFSSSGWYPRLWWDGLAHPRRLFGEARCARGRRGARRAAGSIRKPGATKPRPPGPSASTSRRA